MSNKRYRRVLTQTALPVLLALATPAIWAQAAAQAQGAHKTATHKTAPVKAALKPAKTNVPAKATPTKPIPADYIVAIVNTEPITNNEVRARMARMGRELAASGATPPADLRHAVLEQLITERAELQYAREKGITVSDDALKQAEMTIARQNGLDNLDALHQRMEQEGIPLKVFQNDLRNQVMLQELRAREIDPNIQVSNADVDRFVREQTAGVQKAPAEVNLAMILVAVPEGASADERAKLDARAKDIAAQARSGKDFGQLAAEYSDANGHGADGGALGMRPETQYPDLFIQATQNTPVGGIVGPVTSPAGFHILKVLDRKAAEAEVRVQLTKVRHILLKVSPQQSESVARERLLDIKHRIESGQTTFGAMARKYSQDSSADEGGELGWVPPGQFVPEFEQAMNNLQPGQISDPIVTRFGVHLIEVEDRRERVLSPDEQRDLARNILREQKAQKEFDKFARDVRGRAYVEYREPPQ